MSKHKSAIGIAVLLAVALSAFAASSASALGTTAYTCVKDPEGTLKGAHCLTEGSDNYKHVAFNTKTTITITNANTTANTTASSSITIHGTLSGVATEITCTTAHGEGDIENKTTGEEMYAHGNATLHLTGCTVMKPAGKGCVVKGGTILFNPVTVTTQGVGHAFQTKPKEGTTLANITIESCSVAGLNNTFPLAGSFKSEVSGATWILVGAGVTTENTLKFGGQKAGMGGNLTIKGHEKDGEETKPITVTTS